MNLCVFGHDFRYELEKLCRIFFPFEKINIIDYKPTDGMTAVTELIEDVGILCRAELNADGGVYEREVQLPSGANAKACELALAQALFDCLVRYTGYKPEWGILTGVRPAKLFSSLAREQGQASAVEYFAEQLYVTDNKISLCAQTFNSEEKIISESRRDWFSLYIAIPFCPTRCAYCSFVSHSIEHAGKLVNEYVPLLCSELKKTARIAADCGLTLKTVYIGGGTPTSITASQLDEVMSAVAKHFDMSGVIEYTVEAGRPDTITAEKLEIIKRHGVSRISINPQTMNDSVLENIGRRHTSAQTRAAYALARSCGFNNINMDLIAGLPGDTRESFKSTVDEIISMRPESVTVHALAMKRASGLTAAGVRHDAESGASASFMVEYARRRLSENGILPYYMYRQSKTVGNLENVGYAVPGGECLYNVYIMDETHTILACGASAVTKLRNPYGKEISRIFNFKYPYEYTARFNELINRKRGIYEFYKLYSVRN